MTSFAHLHEKLVYATLGTVTLVGVLYHDASRGTTAIILRMKDELTIPIENNDWMITEYRPTGNINVHSTMGQPA